MKCSNCGAENPEGAKFCNECGSSLGVAQIPGSDPRLASLQQAAPQGAQEKLRAAGESVEGERKPVTILFADIAGSTSIAEKLDPEEWKEVVAGAHQRVGEAIYRYQGTIAQLLGDGVLAFFGAPITHEDDPIRAVRAALDIQESMKTYRQELEGFVDDFQMRVGINTGTVVIGDIGTDLHVEYLAIGDAVNVASRLESTAEPGTVLISESSSRLIGDDFELVDRGELSLKGKSDPLQAYEVVEAIGVPKVRRGIGGAQSPYVGRERELETLRSKIQALREGQGQIVAVLGEPGIGKSRLVAEARRTSQETEGSERVELHWLEGRALSYGSSLSFWLITQLLLDDLELAVGGAALKIKVALRSRVAELFGDDASEAFPYLGHLLGLTDDADVQGRIRELDGETVKRQTLITVAEYFQMVAQQQPTVLVLEDLHWADPSSLEVVSRLMPLTDRFALMIVMPMRIDRDHGSWRSRLDAEGDFSDRFTELRLNRLPEDDARHLVQDLLGDESAVDEIQDLVRSRAGGNPLHLEEIVRHLIEQGAIERANGNWKPTGPIDEIGIPTTLEGVLLARIDRLETEVRNTLQLASVIGRTFLYRILNAISDAERELDWHLSQLQRVDLIREKARQPELEYLFKHALTQEAAYSSLLHERRRVFHGQVGLAIEELFRDRVDEFVGLLAHHFEAAGINDKAGFYLAQAGDKARLEEANREALDYYERLIQLAQESGDGSLEARTWLKVSLVHMREFNYDAAHEAHERAFDLQNRGGGVFMSGRREASWDGGTDESLRIVVPRETFKTNLDPIRKFDILDWQAMICTFSGLTKVDSEANVLPNVAKSWEVLDEGSRYVFHLREDVCWSDGVRVTAETFRNSWLRFLKSGDDETSWSVPDEIQGARTFRNDREATPDAVGINVLDEFTLEVLLNGPVPYFTYLVALANFYPLPGHVIEDHDDDWTRPGNIVSNGAFLLTRNDEDGVGWIRNPEYFGQSAGNVAKLAIDRIPDLQSAIDEYGSGEADLVLFADEEALLPSMREEQVRNPRALSTDFVVFNPNLTPLNDLDVRKALALSIDRSWLRKNSSDASETIRIGGLIPDSMAGYSPGIGLVQDTERALEILEAAGYENGSGVPPLRGQGYALEYRRKAFSHWDDRLRLEIDYLEIAFLDEIPPAAEFHFYAGGWSADYPDPHNFIRSSTMYAFLEEVGWDGLSRVDDLLEDARLARSREQRLEVYRAIDYYLVNEQLVVVPIGYAAHHPGATLVKPWVKNWDEDPMGNVRIEDVRIEREPD